MLCTLCCAALTMPLCVVLLLTLLHCVDNIALHRAIPLPLSPPPHTHVHPSSQSVGSRWRNPADAGRARDCVIIGLLGAPDASQGDLNFPPSHYSKAEVLQVRRGECVHVCACVWGQEPRPWTSQFGPGNEGTRENCSGQFGDEFCDARGVCIGTRNEDPLVRHVTWQHGTTVDICLCTSECPQH